MTLTAKQSTLLQFVNTAIMLAVFNYVVNIEHRLTVLETIYNDARLQPLFTPAPPAKSLDGRR